MFLFLTLYCFWLYIYCFWLCIPVTARLLQIDAAKALQKHKKFRTEWQNNTGNLRGRFSQNLSLVMFTWADMRFECLQVSSDCAQTVAPYIKNYKAKPNFKKKTINVWKGEKSRAIIWRMAAQISGTRSKRSGSVPSHHFNLEPWMPWIRAALGFSCPYTRLPSWTPSSIKSECCNLFV